MLSASHTRTHEGLCALACNRIAISGTSLPPIHRTVPPVTVGQIEEVKGDSEP